MGYLKNINLKDIFFGNLNSLLKLEQAIAEPRLKVCYQCPSRKFKLLNGGVCKHCGCPVKAKATIRKEVCPEGKW